MASLEELVGVDDPAWPHVEQSIRESPRSVEVLPVSARGEALLALGVTVRSVLGALAWHTGGLLLDSGWLRVLGGGSERLPALTPEPGMLVVAYDVLGGRFAVDGGAFGAPGTVHYFAPDSLEWESLEVGHGAFVDWALTGDVASFYEHLRWPGWEAEVAPLPPDTGLSLYPPPFSAEGKDVAAVSRRPVPMAELVAFYGGAAG